MKSASAMSATNKEWLAYICSLPKISCYIQSLCMKKISVHYWWYNY